MSLSAPIAPIMIGFITIMVVLYQSAEPRPRFILARLMADRNGVAEA